MVLDVRVGMVILADINEDIMVDFMVEYTADSVLLLDVKHSLTY